MDSLELSLAGALQLERIFMKFSVLSDLNGAVVRIPMETLLETCLGSLEKHQKNIFFL